MTNENNRYECRFSSCSRVFDTFNARNSHEGLYHDGEPEHPFHNKEWIVEEYIEKERSITEIAKECGVETQRVSDQVKEFGINIRDQDHGYKKYKNKEWLHEQYVLKYKSARQIAKENGVSPKFIEDELKNAGIEIREGGRHKLHASFRTTTQGYEEWYGYTPDSGRRDESIHVHRLLAISEYGCEAVSGKDVHHRNGIPWDNRLENIDLMEKSEHGRLHGKDKDKPALGG